MDIFILYLFGQRFLDVYSVCWGHRYLKTNKKWSPSCQQKVRLTGRWDCVLELSMCKIRWGRASQSNRARRDMREGPKVRPRSRGRTRVGVVKSTNLDFKWGQWEMSFKKSQWFAMFHAMIYPIGKGILLFTVSQLPKIWPKLPSVPHQQIYDLNVGIVAWMVSPLTSIYSFNPSDFKELSLFYTGRLPTTSGHSICTFQAGSKGASWPSAPWPECVYVCVWFVDNRGLYGLH